MINSISVGGINTSTILGFFKSLLKSKKKEVAPVSKAAAKPAASANNATVDIKPSLFSMSRLELVQAMWGQGQAGPLDNDFIKALASPLALNAQKSVLDLSAGLGGNARMLADEFNTYVTGLERDEELARAGEKLSVTSGHGKSAPIQHYNPNNFQDDKKKDALFVCDVLYTIKDKDAFLVRVGAILKPQGHLIMTDYVVPAACKDKPEIVEWMAAEPHLPFLLASDEQANILKKYNFDVRINENINEKYEKMVLKGLQRLHIVLRDRKPSEELKTAIDGQISLWEKRLKALQAGAVYSRYHAIKRG